MVSIFQRPSIKSGDTVADETGSGVVSTTPCGIEAPSPCLTASKLRAELSNKLHLFVRASTAPMISRKLNKLPCTKQEQSSHLRLMGPRSQDTERLRCRPRVPKLVVQTRNPITKESVAKDIAYLQDYDDRVLALRECIRVMFGSVSEIFRRLNCNGDGFLSLSELESGMNDLHIPWQQVTGSTHSELATMIDVGKSDSVDILEFLGAKGLTPRPDWSMLSVHDQWEEYSNRVIEMDLTQMVYSPPLWAGPSSECQNGMMPIESRRKLFRIMDNCCTDANSIHLSRDDMDFIQTKIVKIEKFLKDLNDSKRELAFIKQELASITESQERAAELRKRKEEEEREKQRIKTEAGLALVSGEHGKISIFGKTRNVQLSMFREPDEEELRNYFSLGNPSLLSKGEISFRARIKAMGLTTVQGDKVKKLFSKYGSGGVEVNQDQFVGVLTELLKISPEIAPLSRFKSYWISASGGKESITLVEFLSWYSSSGLVE